MARQGLMGGFGLTVQANRVFGKSRATAAVPW
ncbi:hypothetical protein PENARI_c004G05027 [Penicillium arizonense]|uniref:Uncharacterized protein n=1 Tax=Penicillium arizonense TaxID=1835702 RepID=A0A1F5LQS8_PENAI|nr:hypothetical protein PENARI_c004G05027 [Penicillium arizonense]OGE55380.1 hypothetical protein PENARI_c004G05027 [Penicillium arizonense]